MARIFSLAYPAGLTVRVSSRECWTYLYRVMTFVGWIPPEQGLKRYLYLSWTCFVFTFSGLYLPIGLAFSLIVDFKKFTPGEFLDVFQVSVNIIGASIKAMTALNLPTFIRGMELILDTLDERLVSDNDRLRIHKAVARCNYIFYNYGIFYLGYTLSVLIAGLLTGKPPWLVFNPFIDWRDGAIYLWMQTILEYSIMFMMANAILVMDTFPLIFIIILRGHIDVLKDHIRLLRSNPFTPEAESYKELVSCIGDHKAILRSCRLMHPVISRTIFLQFLLIGIVLGLTLINVIHFANFLRGIAAILFFGAVLLQTFPLCYLCDLLVNDCEELSNLIAQSHWIDAEPKYKSTLRIFMLHVQQPIVFVAGSIFPITINSNVKVAKFGFSVMTIVQKMNLKDRFQ